MMSIMKQRLPRKAYWSKCEKCGVLKRDDQWCVCASPEEIAAADKLLRRINGYDEAERVRDL